MCALAQSSGRPCAMQLEDLADRLHLGRVRLLRQCGVKRNQRGDNGGEKQATHDAIILR